MSKYICDYLLMGVMTVCGSNRSGRNVAFGYWSNSLTGRAMNHAAVGVVENTGTHPVPPVLSSAPAFAPSLGCGLDITFQFPCSCSYCGGTRPPKPQRGRLFHGRQPNGIAARQCAADEKRQKETLREQEAAPASQMEFVQ